jgi:sec-independent protein translocase protein TatA
MFFKGISIGSLLLVFLLLVILFGAKRVRELGGDLGAAVKNFRKGLQEEETQSVVDPSSLESK